MRASGRHGPIGWTCQLKPSVRCRDPHRTTKPPYCYHRNASGRWTCPPGEKYAAQYGLTYRVFSCADINGIAQRNWDFLANYSTWIARLSAKAPRRDSSNRRGWSGDNTVARLQERGATVVTADDTNIWEPKF